MWPPTLNGYIDSSSSARPQSAPTPLGPHILWAEIARKSTAERLDVDGTVRRGLGGVDDHDRALLVRPGGQPLDRVDRAERVRDEAVGDDLHVPSGRELVERVEPKLAVLVDREGAELRAGSAGDVLPRDEVRVVLELGDDHEVARAEVVEPPGVRDEVQRLGGVAREHDLARGQAR